MKIDWRFVLVLVAALITIIALKTQTENLDGDVEEAEEAEEVEEAEEAEEAEETYPDVQGFVASLSETGSKISFTDVLTLQGMSEGIRVNGDTKTFTACSTDCTAELFNNPEKKDEQKTCKNQCEGYIRGVCKSACDLDPKDPVCKTACADYLE